MAKGGQSRAGHCSIWSSLGYKSAQGARTKFVVANPATTVTTVMEMPFMHEAQPS